jgi:Holliday junction DNA helicase RuvA
MISSLQGKIGSLSTDSAIVNVNGIGFLVYMPTGALSMLGIPGTEVKIYTHLHLREDNISLFGFTTVEELRLFETLLSVSGLGPRLALAMLSSLNPEQITTAIATGNREMLVIVPGIGKKVADRIILELRDKIGVGWIVTPAMEMAQENTDVLAALTSLGYSATETTKAIANLPANGSTNLEEKIKIALQYLGK